MTCVVPPLEYVFQLLALLNCGQLLLSIYQCSGVSCNRSGHFGWNQFFNLLKYSLLELQTDKRRLPFEFHTFQRSSKAQYKESSWPSQISSKVKSYPIPILPASFWQEKYLNVHAAQQIVDHACSLVPGVCTILLLFLSCYSPQKSH